MQINREKISSHKLWTVILFCCFGIILYSQTLHSAFHFDDNRFIVRNQNIRNLANLKAIWSCAHSRFIAYLSFALNYHLHHLNVFGYHLFNLIVHLVSAILVWWFCLLTFSTPAMKNNNLAKHAELIACFAGLVFLAHPIQTQSVSYIYQRTASLATLFYLASVSLYVKSGLLLLQYERRGFGVWIFYYAGSLITTILAMFTKEITVTLPLAVLLYEFCFLKTDKGINWKYLIPFLITLAIIPITVIMQGGAAPGEILRGLERGAFISWEHYLFTQFRVIVTYIRLVFLPLNQNLDYHYPIAKSLLELPVLASILFLTIIIITAIRIFPRYRLLSFGIFWFFLTLLPESSIIPITDVIFEHRLYLPMVGFSLFLVSALYYLLGKKIAFGDNSKRFSVVGKVLYTFPHHEKNLRVMITILLLTIACYSVLTYSRNLVWKDDLTLWDDTVRKSPHKSRPYNNRGLAYQDKGDLDLALSDYNKAIQINPNYAEAYNNRGFTYQSKGDLDLALSDYNKAIQINPNLAEAYNNRGVTYQDKGNLNQALSDYNKALQIDSNYAEAYNNRGNIYQNKGDLDLAISDYNQALQIDPDYAEAYNNRGSAYQGKGDLNQVISDYNKAIKINPNLAEAYNNRGLTYQSLGELNQALTDYNKALQINPNYTKAYNNRGLTYQSKGELSQALGDYNKALEINPNLALVYNNRAVVYFLKQEYNKSWKDLHKAEELGYKIHPGFLEELKKASGRER